MLKNLQVGDVINCMDYSDMGCYPLYYDRTVLAINDNKVVLNFTDQPGLGCNSCSLETALMHKFMYKLY